MKEKDIKTIWQMPKYLPYVQLELTDEIIKEAENKMGYKLPKEYIELLKIQNGGYIRFTISDTPHSVISGIGSHSPSITDFEWLQEYKDLSYDIVGLFPFDGDGHWNICLDYRKNKIEPEITYIDTEVDFEKPIAKNFKEYLDFLILETKDVFIIETSTAIEDVVAQISKITRIGFKKSHYWNNGYLIYGGKYKEAFVHLSSNKVPSGFVREEDARFEEFKAQTVLIEGKFDFPIPKNINCNVGILPIMALQYPEVAETSVIISVTNDIEQVELFDVLNKNGINVVPLASLI